MKNIKKFDIIVAIIFVIIMTLATIPTFAQTTTSKNNKLIREYCKANYPKYSIRIVNKYDSRIFENRKGKNIVYVEKFVSYSKGNYGYSKGGEYVSYNKKVEKGKKVVSYFIYNPKTNYCDDVVAVIDCGKIR